MTAEDSKYGKSEDCTFTYSGDATIETRRFELEGDGIPDWTPLSGCPNDWLKVDGSRYCGGGAQGDWSGDNGAFGQAGIEHNLGGEVGRTGLTYESWGKRLPPAFPVTGQTNFSFHTNGDNMIKWAATGSILGGDAGHYKGFKLCAKPGPVTIPVGTSRHSILSGGRARTFIINRPSEAKASGLVFAFHGVTSSADLRCRAGEFARYGKEYGFISVCPDGLLGDGPEKGLLATLQMSGWNTGAGGTTGRAEQPERHNNPT